jgi:ribosomal protein L11 methyltransferase
MHWQQFIMNLESLHADAVEEIFRKHGVQAVTYSDAADDPVLEPAPGETPFWTRTRITGLFSESADLDALREDLMRSLHLAELPRHRTEILADRAWEREWLRDFKPMRFGRRLWVCPTGGRVEAPDAVTVHLDPGLAFGTGTHPTTALCLEWLDGLDLNGKRVLDIGCGSGILSIAALLLGARSAVAVDIDPQAITATRRNAAQNGVAARLETRGDIDSVHETFDVVVANILAGPLVQHAGTICARLERGARIALSGIIDHQIAEVSEAWCERIALDPPAARGRWIRLTGTRN